MGEGSGGEKPKRLVVGVAWYRPEQWVRLREICVDRASVEWTHAEWLVNATNRFAELTAQGYRLERVDVDVEQLLAWCLAQGKVVDGPARSAYAAHLLGEKYRKRRG
jgi:hypothetical protein